MSSLDTLKDLQRALAIRCNSLSSLLDDLKGSLGRSKPALRELLDLFSDFPPAAEKTVADELLQNQSLTANLLFVNVVLRQVNYVTDFVEEHLSHGTRPELSDFLAEEIRIELDRLQLGNWSVCMSHGGPNNFVTTFGDMAGAVYDPLTVAGSGRPPVRYALFKVPRTVGSEVLWRPILLGHEVFHVAVKAHNAMANFDLAAKFDFAAAGKFPNPRDSGSSDAGSRAAGLYGIAEDWAVELLCDAQAMRRFGPAAVSALAEYLTCIDSLESPSVTHPPGLLRLRLLIDALGPINDVRLNKMLKPWIDTVPQSPAFADEWAQQLSTLFLGFGSNVSATVAALPGDSYMWNDRIDDIHSVADAFAAGLTANVTAKPDSWTASDIVNAAWIARQEDVKSPYGALAQKSLEDFNFVQSWLHAGGKLPQIEAPSADPAAGSSNPDPAMLSASQVAKRLETDEAPRRLELRPLLHRPSGSGVDLRLGPRFVVFKRRGISAFDPLNRDLDPRMVQQSVDLAPGEKLILHPNEIVLGATLEYMALPSDLSAQVITRSSYGRLGLLTATAVQVHAGFKGCLTLELVNLSTIPIALTPGERVAQLVLWRSTETDPGSGKYSCPIGPEFSKVRDDDEADVLRTLHS